MNGKKADINLFKKPKKINFLFLQTNNTILHYQTKNQSHVAVM